jgi:hypothetical protein
VIFKQTQQLTAAMSQYSLQRVLCETRLQQQCHFDTDFAVIFRYRFETPFNGHLMERWVAARDEDAVTVFELRRGLELQFHGGAVDRPVNVIYRNAIHAPMTSRAETPGNIQYQLLLQAVVCR